MTTKQLIDALSKLDPEADIIINIKQANKVYGVVQLPINSTLEGHGREIWVNNEYGGSITIHLPHGAYIAGLPKEK